MSPQPWYEKTIILLPIFIVLLIANLVLSAILFAKDIPWLPYLFNYSVQSTLLTRMNGNFTKKELISFRKSVAKAAIRTNTIKVANCNLVPKISKIKRTTPLTFKNPGSSPVFISLPNQKPLSIEPNLSVTITPSTIASAAPFIAGIGCNLKKDTAGILLITQ